MMLLDNMFYNHFDLMRPKVMVVSEKMYQEAQQKKLQARLDYLVEQKEQCHQERGKRSRIFAGYRSVVPLDYCF